MTDEELDDYGRQVREMLKKPGSAKSWERIMEAQNADRWSFALAMNEMAREENERPAEPEANKA